MSSRGKRLISIIAGAGVALLAALYMLRGGGIEPGLLPPRHAAMPNEPIGRVVLESVPIRREVIGSVESRVPIVAASRVAARVTAVRVHAGDWVKPSDVLVELDSADLRAHLREAGGAAAAARAELTRTTADEKRFRNLFQRGSVTAREFDAAEAAWRSASARMTQAEAAVAAARAALQYATVRSPVKGVVVERLVQPGDLAVPGKPLVRLYDANALRVSLQVPEELMRAVKVGMPLRVRIDATGEDISTKVNEIVPAADPDSRTFLVRASLPSGGDLRPGMFARAVFTVGREKILSIPLTAVTPVGQLDTVRVVSDGAVKLRQVSLGRSFGDRVEVLAGLQAGERVLLGPALADSEK
jgi:RND family efflux transporter MFP subunit